jgi:hypothetical protein
MFDVLLGTPDGPVHARTGRPKAYFGSLVHDALYQFLRDGLPIRRRSADGFFLHLLRESDFSLSRLYWAAVRVFGMVVWWGKRWRRRTQGSCTRLRELLAS